MACGSLLSLSIVWILGVKRRLSGLAANALNCSVTHPVLDIS